MKRELHVWFGRNTPSLGFPNGAVIESYDVLCQVLRKESQYSGKGNAIIHTHNIIFANSRIIEEYGFRLFIHPVIGDMFEITFGKCANTDREIKPIHCLWHMLLSGEFDTDECKAVSEDF